MDASINMLRFEIFFFATSSSVSPCIIGEHRTVETLKSLRSAYHLFYKQFQSFQVRISRRDCKVGEKPLYLSKRFRICSCSRFNIVSSTWRLFALMALNREKFYIEQNSSID